MKIRLFLTVSLVLVFVAVMAWNTSAVFADDVCDPDFVMQVGGVFNVRATGVDDTANLQCAFDEAVAYGDGAKVQLQAGNFHTGQIVVNGFHGQFAGAGMDRTWMTNLRNLYVTPIDFYLAPPSIDNPWPALFVFVGGDFVISDLAIHISGENATTGWSIYGIGPITELALGISIIGSDAHAQIDRILLEGEVMENSNTGYSVINGIYFEGFLGEIPWPPISGSLEISDSTFRRIAYATPVFNISDATVKVSRNHYEDTLIAMDVSDTRNTTVEFSHNNVANTWIGFDVWDYFAPQHIESEFLVKNNVIQGEIGIAFEQTFGEGNECLLLGNNVQNVTDLGVYLGPGTTGCMVVGGNNKANVLNFGTNNILVGVNNMGTGVGPDIHRWMRPK